MTKISNIIQINSGYTSYVDLYEEYYDLEKNRGRMGRYSPIAAHRTVFEKVANILNPLDRRFYFLSGSYGTGKSHLLLMFANYFANPSDLPEIETFFENYENAQSQVLLKPDEELQETKAKVLKEKRKSGRFLVAICRYSLNLNFEGALLRALEEAIEEDHANILIDSHYQEANRRLKDWEERKNDVKFFHDFENAVGTQFPDWTTEDILDGLSKYDDSAFSVFRTCFKTVTDTEFKFEKDNLRDIISDFLTNPKFKERYQGIIFFYDEFGSTIDAGLVEYRNMLDFAQFCANSTMDKGGTVAFIGTGHKAFRNHGTIGDLNAETLEARVTEIGLETQGMEDIISAIVQPNINSIEWANQVQPHSGKFTRFSYECNRLTLFNWLPAPKIKINIIQNIYPMHPLATFALLRLANEAGSDTRSVFKFFAPEFETGEGGWVNVQPFSYPWFIENRKIIENNKLILYTADLLADYFKESLKATNTRLIDRVKNSVINYEATLRELNAYVAKQAQSSLFDHVDELMLRIIKVMLINEISSTENRSIPNTAQNIRFGLDFDSPEEAKQIEDRLRLLCQANVLYFDGDVYELTRSDRLDVQRLVDQYKANPDNHIANVLQTFEEFVPLKADERFLEARDYNATYNEDKRLKVLFATPHSLSEPRIIDGSPYPFFESLEVERLSITNRTQGYEGIAVYVFCENEKEIEIARKFTSENDQVRVVIAIPRAPTSVIESVKTLKALESDWFKKLAQDFSPFEKSQEKTIRDEANKALSQARSNYFANSKVYWFGKSGVEIGVQEARRHDVANKVVQALYEHNRNTFAHNEFNKSHIKLSGNTLAIFKEAGDILCDLTQPIQVNWSWPDNRGGTRYLRRCFTDHQILRIFNTLGDVRYLEPEKDIEKFRSTVPAYAHLLESIGDLEANGEMNFNRFIKPYFDEFGLGEIAITLMMLLARRFFGDSLRFKLEPNVLSDIQFTSSQVMLDLVQDKYLSPVILFEPVSDEDKSYFSTIAKLFSTRALPAGKVYTISEAFQTATAWWDALLLINRSTAFYTDEYRPLAELFNQSKTKDPFVFVKYDLLERVGFAHNEILTAEKIQQIESHLTAFKEFAEDIQKEIEDQILTRVAEIFDASSILDVDIQQAFKDWYHGLSVSQKDPMGSYLNNDSKPLIRYTEYVDIRKLLFVTLPDAYAFGKVEIWTHNLIEHYVQRIVQGMNHIETHGPKVEIDVEVQNALSESGDLIKQVAYKGELTLTARTEDAKGEIYYTEDGSDPTSSAQRKVLAPGESITVTGNVKIKIAASDGEGNYSAIKTIDAIDELVKHKIVRPVQSSAFDETITFVFPKEKEDAKVTIRSLLRELIKSGLFTEEELSEILPHIFEQAKN
ncbi:MAG: chitobiase/beta-hexosaminidase C-terminal domain-containing protein [Anaerolineaceae bacterium]